MSRSFFFRPGTEDEANFRAVIIHNEYRLPTQLPPNSLVLDIGVHCGSFVCKAIQCGAVFVDGYEPEVRNFEAALYNLADYWTAGRVRVQLAAIWRSDGKGPETLTFCPSEDRHCTGGGNVLWGNPEGQKVATIPLDNVLTRLSQDGKRRVHLMKIDCEGSEWPILLTSNKLHLVDRIVGEYHEIGGPHMTLVKATQAHRPFIPECAKVDGITEYTAETLESCLSINGFTKVEIIPGQVQPWLGWFFASR